MKRKKLNTKKLLAAIGGVIITIYILTCAISYVHKTTEKVMQYTPKETTIIVK